MTANDSIDNYREVTAAERTALEKSDAAWVRPPQAFIDKWNNECMHYNGGQLGKYNEESGYFELNGITDISYHEALRIWARSVHTLFDSNAHRYLFGGHPDDRHPALCRTYFPLRCANSTGINMTEMFYGNRRVQVVSTEGYYALGGSWGNYANLTRAFCYCAALKKVMFDMGVTSNVLDAFKGCRSLVSMTLTVGPSTLLNLSDSPLISDESISKIINQWQKSPADKPATLMLHPDAYARVTPELIDVAINKNVNIATT